MRLVRDRLITSELTAAPSWRALLPTQTLHSASALQTRFPVWTVPSAKWNPTQGQTLLLVLEEPHGMLLKRGRMTSGVTKTVVLQVAKWRVVAALMKTGSLLAAHMMECMKYAGMKIQIHKNSRIGTMDVHCVPVSMLAPKRRSASRVRDGSTTQRIALTATTS